MDPKDLTQNRRVAEIRSLDSPRQLRQRLPLTADLAGVVVAGREAVISILDGQDDRLLVVVGPCSIHDPEAGLEYARRLVRLAGRHRDELHIVMRAYFEKPRTTVGWKGLTNDPGLDGSFRVGDGLSVARAFLLDVLSLGLPVGCEFLDPITPQYLADTVSWGAIGARTTQSQIHRQLASGLSMPVGFKNSTEGDVQVAVDAIASAGTAQVFPGIDDRGRAAVVATEGNPDCHLVLRGSTSGPNYDEAHVADALGQLERSGMVRRLVVDASHGNSRKDHRLQPSVAVDISQRVAAGERGIVGVMLESFLIAGRQDLGDSPLVFGQSITDACMGWEATVDVLGHMAAAVVHRRESLSAA